MKIKKIITILIIAHLIGILIWNFSDARYDKFYNPILKGNVSGTRLIWTFNLGDPTADQWLLGDTTAAGMYVPEQPIEIIDIKIFGDPDSGDTSCVHIYAANGDLANETILSPSDSLCGTAYIMIDDQTMSSTYKTVTTIEGLALLYDHIAGTPNKVQIILEAKTRIADAYE